MLAVGDPVPPFEGTDQRGEPIHREGLRGRTYVLFFYPRAGSLGCTREALNFAERFPEFAGEGVEVIGISVDDRRSVSAFSSKCQLPYRLIADEDRSICRSFGVLGAFGFARRVTFFVGPDGRVVHVTDSLLPKTHVEEAFRFLKGHVPSSPVAPGGTVGSGSERAKP